MGVPHKMAGFVLAILACVSLVQGNVFTVDLAQLAVERLDPIVFNGMSPEGHVHTISGGDGFSKTGSFGELVGSSCTTGNVKKDLSNYWVPSLYIKKPNGQFHYVPTYFSVYYKLINDCCQTTPPGGTNPIVPGSIRSFPDGFKMIAGGPGATGPWNGGGIVNHKCMGPYIDPRTSQRTPSSVQVVSELRYPSHRAGTESTLTLNTTTPTYRTGWGVTGREGSAPHLTL